MKKKHKFNPNESLLNKTILDVPPDEIDFGFNNYTHIE